MRKMTSLVVIAAALAIGCNKKKRPEEGTTPPPAPVDPTPVAKTEPPKPLVGDDVAKHHEACWDSWNAGKLDELEKCYAATAIGEQPGLGTPASNGPHAIAEGTKLYKTAFPDMKGDGQLTLVNGHHIVAVTLLTGTHSGVLKTPMGDLPATNKKVGMFLSQVLDIDDAGLATHEWDFFDLATMLGQIAPQKDHPVRPAIDKLAMAKEVVIAKDDDKEKANLATFGKMIEAFDKHDIKAFGELVADGVVWSEQAQPKDMTKAELLVGAPALWTAFSDLKFNVSSSWAAGDYVAAVEMFEGTNDGDLAMMKVKKTGKKVQVPVLAIHKFDAGKVNSTWVFFQGMDFARQLGILPSATK